MRIHIVFSILLALLCLARVVDLVTAIQRIRLTVSMESLFKEPNSPTGQDDQKLAALEEEKSGYVDDAIQAGVELLMLGGVCYCFVRVWRKRAHDNAA